MIPDIRLAARMLRKQPGFTAIAVVTLALGIGATSAVFSLIDGVLLTPPPYDHPDRLALIQAHRADGQKQARPQQWAAAQWSEWQKESKTFDAIAGYGWTFNFLVRDDGSESMEGMWVSGDYFRITGLKPFLGRTFSAAETVFPTAPVVILGYNLWQRKFGGDPHILGKTIRLSRQDVAPTVIGVMPPGVRFLPSPGAADEPNYNVNAPVDFWIPSAPDPKSLNDPYWDVVGRLRAGVSPRQGEEDLKLIVERQAQSIPAFEGFVPHAEPLADEMNRDGRRILFPLLGAAALVLLIACGNVAALLLVRGLQRQQEYAVRSALGVSRWALFRQVSTESLFLALAGGLFGVLLGVGVVKVFKLIGGHAIPRLDAVTTGWPVLICGVAAAILASGLAGLIPALRASRLDPMGVLKSAGPKSSAGRGERRLLRGVTMVQTALTLSLLMGAGLLIRTMINVSNVQSGYNTSHILTMTVTAVQGDLTSFHRRALERVSQLPAVQKAAFAWGVPLTGNDWPATVEIEGQPPAIKASDRLAIPLRSVTTGYFDLLGSGISQGRDFRSTDEKNAPAVMIVNQALADRYFPRSTAIGRKIWLGGRDHDPAEIVGVVRNGRTDDLTHAAEPEIYVSFWQFGAFSKSLVLRTQGDPRTVMSAVARQLHAVDPTAAVENMKTLDQIRDDSLASRTFAMQLLVGFAAVGSLLTLVGIYGVLSLSVAARRREIAIRAAVGAGQKDIRKLVFAEGVGLIAGGVVSGIAAAFVLARVLRSFLYQVDPADPVTLLAVGALFAGVALLACWQPTRRAAKIDPIEALRYD
ncbi:MAG TPA: ABC transporter permease [Bryobacteraceae bacterium]|jgi:putative ABC transport system permease protein|nr:ABC transporter permease [Bryobacteraceae bacterium]